MNINFIYAILTGFALAVGLINMFVWTSFWVGAISGAIAGHTAFVLYTNRAWE